MSLHGVFAMAAGFGTGAGGNPRTTDTDSGLSDDWMSVRARYSSRKKVTLAWGRRVGSADGRDGPCLVVHSGNLNILMFQK